VTPTFAADLALRSSALLACAWLAAAAVRLRGGSAATRHAMWMLGFATIGALPLLAWLLPPIGLPILPPEPVAQALPIRVTAAAAVMPAPGDGSQRRWILFPSRAARRTGAAGRSAACVICTVVPPMLRVKFSGWLLLLASTCSRIVTGPVCGPGFSASSASQGRQFGVGTTGTSITPPRAGAISPSGTAMTHCCSAARDSDGCD